MDDRGSGNTSGKRLGTPDPERCAVARSSAAVREVEFKLSQLIKLASAAPGKVEHLRPRRLPLAGFELITVGRF
jgi:hypothetical protein